jgi:XRE family transcriptional regulator, regulator of sulfur utilization
MSDSLATATSSVARSIKAHREARRMSLGALARESGLSKPLLSRLESGAGNPSLETLWRLARAFDVTLGTLLGEADPPRTRLIRAEDGTALTSESGMGTRLILAEGRTHRTEIHEIYLLAGTEYLSRHMPGTEELVMCLEGSLEAGPEGQEAELAAGDALWFPADLPHRYFSRDGARALSLMSYPPATPG